MDKKFMRIIANAALLAGLAFSANLVAAPIVYNAPSSVTLQATAEVLPVVSAGTPCVSASKRNTGISADNKLIFTCVGNVWRSLEGAYWKDPVTNYAALSMIASDPIGSARITTDTGRIFVWNGANWIATAVDQNGNITIPGTASVANTLYAGAVSSTGLVSGAGVYSSGNVSAAGDLTTSGNIYANGSASINSNISTNGSLYVAGGINGYGNSTISGNSTTYGNSSTYGYQYGYASSFVLNDNWGLLLYGAGWNGNAAPQSAVGSAYVNDVYIRSIGKWASQLAESSSGKTWAFDGPLPAADRVLMCYVNGYGRWFAASGWGLGIVDGGGYYYMGGLSTSDPVCGRLFYH